VCNCFRVVRYLFFFVFFRFYIILFVFGTHIILLDECSVNNGGCASTEDCTLSVLQPTPNCTLRKCAMCESVDCINQICRPSIGPCDVAEVCNGTLNQCPPDQLALPSTICRPSNGSCDVAEVRGIGNLGSCPPDVNLSLDTCQVCGGNGLSCISQYPVCGDGFCAKSESCATCVIDCALLCEVASNCPSSLTCGNGSCVSGSCVCEAGWGGANCDQVTQTIFPSFNKTFPMATILVNGTTSISVSYVRIEEVTPDGVLVQFKLLDSIQYQQINRSTSEVMLIDYIGNLGGASYIFVSFKFYQQLTYEIFANQSIAHSPNTLTGIIQITNWPFNNINNLLRIWTSDQGFVIRNKRGDNGNFEWVEYLVNGYILFVRFPDTIEVDGTPRTMQVAMNNSEEIYLVVPHFWNYVIIDPDYGVLVASNSETKPPHPSNKKLFIIAAVVIICGMLIIAVIIFYGHKKRQQATNKKFNASIRGA